MTDADVVVDQRDVELDPLSRAFVESEEASLTARKNVEILTGYAGRPAGSKLRRIVLRFLMSPVEILGEERVTGLRACRNVLVDDGGAVRAKPTDEVETIDCGLVFRSIGYRGTPLEDLPFDERAGVIPHDAGRINVEGGSLPGEYVTGWIKRGPTGIIGTNKRDAQETVDALLEDLDAGRLPNPVNPDREALEELLAERRPDHVTYAGWQAIDRAEKGAGEPHGRPRVKLATFEELLEAARERVG
jgi:ferredoxin--NADP+ reductase